MKCAAFLAVAVALVLAGCGGIEKGTVTGKFHEPARSSTWMMPTYATFCTGSGSSRICNQVLTGMIPMVSYDDEDWVLYLENGEGETGKVYVDQSDYDEARTGDYWGGKHYADHDSKRRADS